MKRILGYLLAEENTNKLVLAGIVLGVLFGIYLPEWALAQKALGKAFVAFLKMLVVPLVFASVYVAISGLGGLEQLRRIGLKTIGLYVITTALAVMAAIVAMNLFPIGEPVSASGLEYARADKVEPFSLSKMLLSFIPTNIFNALATGSLMQVIVFAILLALASLYLEERHHRALLDVFTGLSEALLKLAAWIVRFTPLGVFSLISYVVADQGIEVLVDLWKYILMVLGVILFHGLVTLPGLMYLLTRANPYDYLRRVREVPLMAFSTASSAATLPVSLKVSQEKGGVSQETASFVLPLGATVSMDGTAAYLTIAVLYIANLAGVPMTFGDQLVLGFTVVALSVGVAALPSASLVMMVVILNQAGLPVAYMAIIVAVDRILDMARTALNVTSDLVVAKTVDLLNAKRPAEAAAPAA